MRPSCLTMTLKLVSGVSMWIFGSNGILVPRPDHEQNGDAVVRGAGGVECPTDGGKRLDTSTRLGSRADSTIDAGYAAVLASGDGRRGDALGDPGELDGRGRVLAHGQVGGELGVVVHHPENLAVGTRDGSQGAGAVDGVGGVDVDHHVGGQVGVENVLEGLGEDRDLPGHALPSVPAASNLVQGLA